MTKVLRRMLLTLALACAAALTVPADAVAQIWCPDCDPYVGCTVVEGAGLRWCANIEVFDFDFCVGGGTGYCTGEPISALDGTVIPGSVGAPENEMPHVPLPVSWQAAEFALAGIPNDGPAGRLYRRGCQNVIIARKYEASVALEMRIASDRISL